MAMPKSYPLDNTSQYAEMQHAALAALLDPFSSRRTLDLFGADLSGKNCLDAGAGAGGFAHWLTHQVGPLGRVTAIDLKPERIPEHDRLTVLRCDLTAPETLPHDQFDFVHARLTLGHLPEREEILHWIVSVLAPGGVALIEDWDASRTDMVLSAPTSDAAKLYTRFQECIGAKVFARSGTDRTWARRVHGRMVSEHLIDVDTIMYARSWAGGGPGCRLVASSLGHTRHQLVAAGLTDAELQEVRQLLDDPRLVLAGHLLYSTSGRKPPA
jgi:2-polyprenyl-3-methyl-5-hydroxy-6-metoxy-1,4-benzoquinol methylase